YHISEFLKNGLTKVRNQHSTRMFISEFDQQQQQTFTRPVSSSTMNQAIRVGAHQQADVVD
ncbi:hypothetical protein, partial [Pseudomonas sp. AFG_SD02_1510_Pfu_092]|uniref:hypothetical protein n=1 Tax=Pseudomonas sp. AFG_SD02_1510_Pfu_092 TaxID=2259497 RepID=UPI0019D44B1F